MSDEVKESWDDDRINRLIRDILTEQPNHTPRGLARRTAYTVRDDLQAELAAEKAKVAELERQLRLSRANILDTESAYYERQH